MAAGIGYNAPMNSRRSRRPRRTDARSDGREAQVAAVAAEAVEPPDGRLLLTDDADGALAAAIATDPAPIDRWDRLARGDRPARPWPAAGPFAGATLRMPKAKAALDMALHGLASVLAPGGVLWLYGANDEGIRSAGKRLDPLFAEAETVLIKRRCRVWRAVRTDAPARAPLAAWRSTITIALPDDVGARVRTGAMVEVPWVEYPGVFAAGRLDPASAALLAAVAPFGARDRVLDFGCGAGALSAAIRRTRPEAALHLLDADAVAIEAARENVPDGALHLGDGWRAAPDLRVDRIVSNPPIHRGKGEDFAALAALIAEAPRHLRSGGMLELVVQSQVPVRPWLEAAFARVEAVGDDRRFTVWRAR